VAHYRKPVKHLSLSPGDAGDSSIVEAHVRIDAIDGRLQVTAIFWDWHAFLILVKE
tara:strand:+ start:194 stop:361 length:168 start_codon:yes stop_codon:yes gene_type:complete